MMFHAALEYHEVVKTHQGSLFAELVLTIGPVFSQEKTDDHPASGEHIQSSSFDLRSVRILREYVLHLQWNECNHTLPE